MSGTWLVLDPRPVVVTSGLCVRCGHVAQHSSEPWDNQFRCAESCRCTMQGCCPAYPLDVRVGVPG